jgi:hypothetical protein
MDNHTPSLTGYELVNEDNKQVDAQPLSIHDVSVNLAMYLRRVRMLQSDLQNTLKTLREDPDFSCPIRHALNVQ